MPDGRFVWITREQRDMLLRWNRIGTPSRIVAAWDAAPADPVNTARGRLSIGWNEPLTARSPKRRTPETFWWEVATVLAALGLPSSDETTG